MANQCIPGYQFLCEVLSNLYVSSSSQMKKTLQDRSKSGAPMEEDDIKTIQEDFVEYAYELKISRKELWEKLDVLLGNYYTANYNKISTNDFFDKVSDKHSKKKVKKDSLKSMFNSLLLKRDGTSSVSLAGIAMTVVLAVGHAYGNLYVGSSEVYAILTKSMEILGYNNAEFIPEGCLAIEDGNMDYDLLCLLLLALLGALKVKFPHKKNAGQSERNKEKAREYVDNLIGSDLNSSVFAALRGSSEMSRICQGMADALRDDSEQVRFPNDKTITLDRFYQIPRFEIIGNSTTEILRCDYNYYVRSLVIGKTGSGKSLLTKAVVRTCLCSPESRDGVYAEYAKVLGLENRSFFPLVLNCKEIFRKDDIEKLDLIGEAVNQLVCLTRNSAHASCLEHWDDFAHRIVEYYMRKAKNSALILIIEDISSLGRKLSESLLSKLREMERTEYSRLHILVVTQQLINSQMMYFINYNRAEIVPVSFSLEEKIGNLVDLGLGASKTENYLDLLENNRHARAFVDSPDHLIKLLCHPYEESFDLDALLRQTIDEHIEGHFCAEVTDNDCREFLTVLAVSVAENQKNTRHPDLSRAVDYRNIPKNIVNKEYLSPLAGKVRQPDVVWQYIMDNMILVCPNSGINGYTFVNSMLYCSLVADYYLQLVRTQHTPNWLDRFNRLSAEDFSYIIVMLLNRLYRDASDDNMVSAYDILILLQSIVGYTASQTDSIGLFWCLMALQDMLSNKQFKNCIQPHLWEMLEQVYSNGYSKFAILSDDSVKKSWLMKPEHIGR